MKDLHSVIEALQQMDQDEDKSKCLTLILRATQDRTVKLSREDKLALVAFSFREIDNLIQRIPAIESYREKDPLLEYGDQLIGIVMLCYASPAEIAEDKLNLVKALHEMMNKALFIENAISEIFDQGHTDPVYIEHLLCLVIPLRDEYQKAKLYQGLLHYQQGIRKLPEDSKALLANHLASEMKRYLDSTLDEDMIDAMELACDVCGYFMNDTLAALLQDALKLGKANISYYAISSLLKSDRPFSPDPSVIAELADNVEYASLTYALLKSHGMANQFPEALATPEYLAKSDMIHWLIYPTELGMIPDEIECLGKVKKKEEYYIFRFRSESKNLDDETKGKWLIGWSSEEGGTFSNFDLYQSFEKETLEKTLKYIKKKLL